MSQVETSTSFADQIFSALGSLRDGAVSVYGDYLEYQLLEKELEAQAAGINTTTAPPAVTQGNGTSASLGGLNQSHLAYGAIGLSVLATLFVAFK